MELKLRRLSDNTEKNGVHQNMYIVFAIMEGITIKGHPNESKLLNKEQFSIKNELQARTNTELTQKPKNLYTSNPFKRERTSKRKLESKLERTPERKNT